uniref:Uncharacterized protein n=1 Tax=Tanacetum cinerariifolium TaxID=118510 RepID=A0A6L2PAU3_TANCI|nr:hypothetical protein [Tanacetum cinerariifolium]
MTKLPTCTCDANKELLLHHQLMKLMQFLIRLDDCYQPVRSAFLIRDSLLEVKNAYTIVSREESHRGVLKSSSTTELKISATSSTAKSFNKNRRVFNYNNNTRGPNNNNVSNVNGGPNPNLIYKSCGMIGHTIERCYELIGYLIGFKKVSNPIKKNGFNNLIDDTPSRSVRANMAGRASFFNVGMFDVVDITNLKITVGHQNGTLVTISHVGNLKFSNNVVLYDVFVVPGYCVSLMAKWTMDPFPLSEDNSKDLGELVHLDLWGPYRVPKKEAFKLPSSVLNGKSPYE